MSTTKWIFAGLVLLLCPVNTIQADSFYENLSSSISAVGDEEKVELLIEIADSLSNSDPDEAERYYDTAVSLARILNDPHLLAKSLNSESDFEYNRGFYEKSLELTQEAFRYYTAVNDSDGMAMSLMGMGNCYGDMSMISLAMDSYIACKSIMEDLKDTIGLAYLHLNLGATHSEMDDIEMARQYYLLAREEFDKVGYEEELADVIQNLGNFHSNTEDNEKALSYYEQAIAIYEEHGLEPGLRLCLVNAAGSLSELDRKIEALDYLNRSIEMSTKSQDASTLTYALNTKADLLTRLGKYDEAWKVLNQAASLAQQNHFLDEITRNLETKAIWYHATGDQLNAYLSQVRYDALRDSLLEANKMSEINSQMLAYETSKRDQHIKRLEAEMEREQLSKSKDQLLLILLCFFAIILCISGVFIYLAYNKKKNSEALLKEQQSELAHINYKLEEEKKNAELANSSKSEFLSMMTHELRTPLNAVVGIAQMLEGDQPHKQKAEALNTLKFASNNLLTLINDILDYNKLETGNIKIEGVDFNLTKLLQNIRMSFQVPASEKSISFSVHRAQNVPAMVKGDPTRLTQILTNLVANAIKFTHQGFVRVYAEPIHCENGNASIRFIVKDTGIGIPKEKQKLIFESFQQADQSTNRKFGGSGLGLAICKRLIELMGGDLKLESDPGMGSNFTFELPFSIIDQTDNLEVQRVDEAEIEEMKAALKYSKVLLVDDNEMNLFVARNLLQKIGIDTIEASSGYEAIDMIEDSKNVDLVLLDLQMPGIDGFDTAVSIRSIRKNIPIIALTASSKEEVNLRNKGARFDGFVRKPFEMDELITSMFHASGLKINQKSA